MRNDGPNPDAGDPPRASVPRPRRVAILGSTGSIGTSTLDVLSEPLFDDLKTDPRYQDILKKIGLT